MSSQKPPRLTMGQLVDAFSDWAVSFWEKVQEREQSQKEAS